MKKLPRTFYPLQKNKNKSESLLDLCKDNGEPFETAGERESFIQEYYGATYRSVANNVNGHSISNFLGDVANHPEVIASKLNQEERDDLEKDISINEFNKALEKAKLNTAPCIDSISNVFIKTFWHIFHVPLFEYTKCCYGKGTQTENFRCEKLD
jgi:hypothetical protein